MRASRYDYIVHSRLEFVWLRPHPPLRVLRNLAPRCVWVPGDDDYGGLNDRHAVVPRALADVYFSRYDRVIDGRLLQPPSCWSEGAACGLTSERYTAPRSSYELRVTSYELRVTTDWSGVTS